MSYLIVIAGTNPAFNVPNMTNICHNSNYSSRMSQNCITEYMYRPYDRHIYFEIDNRLEKNPRNVQGESQS